MTLALMLAAPPVEAGACFMNAGQDASMAAESGHDCCPNDNPGTADEDPACDGSVHCGACVSGTAAIPSAAQNLFFWENTLGGHSLAASLPPSHDSPPFRPPIS